MDHLQATHRRRRRREFWRKLRNPRTLKAIIKVAWIIYRIIRWLIEVLAPYG